MISEMQLLGLLNLRMTITIMNDALPLLDEVSRNKYYKVYQIAPNDYYKIMTKVLADVDPIFINAVSTQTISNEELQQINIEEGFIDRLINALNQHIIDLDEILLNQTTQK